ncbi:phage terminase large subunit [Sphingomonas sp. CD22]|uniref:phage terminase large subunit n=1 Tax=Sphingomonas sp. CD22 TaxID=3100214 RepID=UPI002ADF5494|nr:phage terminase large subunit [Sphingomonas sp. CD22]MEA1085212.1 phage terminase large subunit [Sphingomonas sp. CD22]
MTPLEYKALAAARRQRLSLFLVKAFETLHPGERPLQCGWYIQSMCYALEQVERGEERRLVITVPPRHLKSVTASVAFVAWALGRDPTLKIMVASYSQELSRQHAVQCRTLLESAWYQRLFPNTRIADGGNRALEVVTTRGGMRKGVSVGGSVTGFGADLIIVDDCMKADDVKSVTSREEVKGWFGNTLFTRLNDKQTGRILSIQQRLHEDDLPAMLLERGYRHLNLPAIAEREEEVPIGPGRVHRRAVGDLLNPAREDRALLDRIRRELGPAVFSAQYQQDPVAPEGNAIRMEWFRTYDEPPARNAFTKVIQSWDTGMSGAPTSDFSVCTTWGFRTDKWYLLDVYRQRLDFPDLRNAMIRLWQQWEPDRVLIEDAGAGKSVAQDIRLSGKFTPMLCKVATDKMSRFTGCFGEIEAGNILLPVEAPWLDELRKELRAFPHGRHDDQVDSLSQFINHQKRHWAWVITEIDPVTQRVRRPIHHSYRPWGRPADPPRPA